MMPATGITNDLIKDSTHIHTDRVQKKNINSAMEKSTATMWVGGIKLHLIINDKGEILNFMFTPGNVDCDVIWRTIHLSSPTIIFGKRIVSGKSCSRHQHVRNHLTCPFHIIIHLSDEQLQRKYSGAKMYWF